MVLHLSKKHLRRAAEAEARKAAGIPEGPFPCTWWQRVEPEPLHALITIYRNIATGAEVEGWTGLPIGALFAADWDEKGDDGLSIACKLPDGHLWYIDSRASNCDMPNDDKHRCWVRHGTVGERVHVDKNGLTCHAGAGSIRTSHWHGFLHSHQLSVQK